MTGGDAPSHQSISDPDPWRMHSGNCTMTAAFGNLSGLWPNSIGNLVISGMSTVGTGFIGIS